MENTNVQFFEHEEFGKVRVVMIDGNPWFVAVDVCRVLEISNSRDAVARLDDDEKDAVGITDTIGREQQTTIINEPGLYRLIFSSRKPEAKKFQRWVYHEVLPSIRKTGAYFVDDENPLGYNDTTPGADFWWEVKQPRRPSDFRRGIELKKLASHTHNPELRELLIAKAASLIAGKEIYSAKRFF